MSRSVTPAAHQPSPSVVSGGLPLLAVGLLAMGLASPSHAASSTVTAEATGAAPVASASACGTLAGKRFVFEVQGMYDTGYNALPFVEAGQLVFDVTGATGSTSGYNNGPGPISAHPSTTFSCTNLTLPRGFAQLAFADGRTYQLVANNAVNLLKMIRVDAKYFAGGEAKLSTDWSTLPSQACSLLSGKTYLSALFGSVLVYTPASGAYSAFADIWNFTTLPGKLSGVWEFGANSPNYHAESGTQADCSPYDDGSAIVTWTNAAGYFENGYVIFPNADGSAAAVISTLPGQGAGGWLVKR
jgi:hypothetical protein